MCSHIDTELLMTKYLLSKTFVNQYETQMFFILSTREIITSVFYGITSDLHIFASSLVKSL